MSRRGRQWLGYLIMVIGAVVLLGPYVQGEIETRKQEQAVAELHRKLAVTTAVPTATPAVTPRVTEEVTATPEAEVTGEPEEENTPAVTENLTVTEEPQPTEEAEPTEEPEPTDTPEECPVPTVTEEPDDPFFRAAVEYNQSLFGFGKQDLDSVEDMERFALNAMDYGFPENAIGTVYIPRIEVEVPLYLGTTDDHMARGFAVFGKTSLPLGLGTENVAIAGHRGWKGTAMLRDVQMILTGDPIYVTTPWRTLTYRVTELEIVTPRNTNWCRLKEGKTMISLMTCHPYGQHTHRYIVHAELEEESAVEETAVEAVAEVTATPVPVEERTAEPEPETVKEVIREEQMEETTAEPVQAQATAAVTELPTTAPTEAQAQMITWVNEDGTTETILMDTGALDPDESEYTTVWSNTLIGLEDSMRPVAYAVAALVLIVGVWLTAVTVRERRRK